MRLRGTTYFAVLTVVLLLGAAGASNAGVLPTPLHEDLVYWYQTENEQGQPFVDTAFSLDGIDFDDILVAVQQTVYDESDTADILESAGKPAVGGYLYAYTVWNYAWHLDSGGITAFKVDWGSVIPRLVTIGEGTTGDWLAVVDGPRWVWTAYPGTSGITVDSATFWAVAGTGDETWVPAIAATGTTYQVDPENWDILMGNTITTGPVPEPGNILTILLGVSGLAFGRFRKR